MLNIRLKVSEIDYPATFHTFYPLLSAHFTKPGKKDLLRSLLAALGDDAERVFLSWLPYLEETERRKLMAGVVNQNGPRMTPHLNEKLQSHEIGRCIRLSAMRAYLSGSDFVLELVGIQLEIPALAEAVGRKKKLSPLIVLGLKGLSRLGPDVIEKKGAELMAIPEIRGEIRRALQDTLSGKGIVVTVEDIEVVHEPTQSMLPPVNVEPGRVLNEESETILVNALARYLRDKAGPT